MPYQSYYYQNPEVYQKSRLNSAIARWQPSGWDTFTSGAEESFTQYTALGWLAKEAQEWDVFGELDHTKIKKEEWNKEHYLWRSDIQWDDNMTIGIAKMRRERSDRLSELTMYRNNVDFWSLPNLSGVLGGALLSPENLVAWGGMIGRAGTLATLARTTRVPVTSRFIKPVFQGMADAAIADTLFQSVKATVQLNRGENIDGAHAAFEIGLATLTGGFIGTFPMAGQVAKKIPAAFKPVVMRHALNNIAESKPVSFFKDKGRKNAEEELDPETMANTLNEKIKETADDNDALYSNASTGVIKDFVNNTLKGTRKLVNVLANCIRKNKI